MAAAKNPIVRKIQRVKLQGFRGFVVEQTLVTNADIVLLVGPNGVGKTSLLQALALLLTGHPELDDLFALEPPRGRAGESPIEERAKQAMEVSATVVLDESTPDKAAELKVIWTPNDPEPSFSGEPSPWPRELCGTAKSAVGDGNEQAPNTPARARELLARVTSFYPERVDALFNSLTTGSTLRDVFFPVPEPVRAAIELLKRLRSRVQEERSKLDRLKATPEQLEQQHVEAFRALKERWLPIRAVVQVLDRIEEPAMGQAQKAVIAKLSHLAEPHLDALETALQELLAGEVVERRDVAIKLVDELQRALNVEIERARQKARDVKDAEVLESELRDLDARLKRIEARYPALDSDLSCFAPHPEQPRTVDLLTLFRSISEERDRWLARAEKLSTADRFELGAVLRELEAVVPANARIRAQELERWLDPRRQVARERDEIHSRRAEILHLLLDRRFSEDVARLREAAAKLKAEGKDFQRAYRELVGAVMKIERQPEIRSVEDDLEKLEKTIADTIGSLQKATGANEQILQHTVKLATAVLSRFSMVERILPLRVVQLGAGDTEETTAHARIETHSGLELWQLSTGQKAQVAVSLTAAQAELLRHAPNVDLPFHVLLLDDVSTAYDLSNITREAVLWRQLAYHKRPEQRWQLFIASHHEDLTNHLLDLLVPPHGCTLRVLRFEGWSWDTGPVIEQLDIEPSRQIDDEARRHIAQSFKEVLCLAS
jgi:energy-coupling factor transporter ATP-binding protein EcfA2